MNQSVLLEVSPVCRILHYCYLPEAFNSLKEIKNNLNLGTTVWLFSHYYYHRLIWFTFIPSRLLLVWLKGELIKLRYVSKNPSENYSTLYLSLTCDLKLVFADWVDWGFSAWLMKEMICNEFTWVTCARLFYNSPLLLVPTPKQEFIGSIWDTKMGKLFACFIYMRHGLDT